QGAQRPQLASPTFTTAQPPPAAKTHHLQATLLSSSFVTGEEKEVTQHILVPSLLLPTHRSHRSPSRKRGDEHVDHHRGHLSHHRTRGKKGCRCARHRYLRDADHRRP
ncbi:hypothetical protein Dimus_010267, partial [Dionaea muscipula]